MESRVGFMSLVVVWFFLLTQLLTPLCANDEVEALNAFMNNVHDPIGNLVSWVPTRDGTPCTWSHITCDGSNHVIKVDLGNSRLSGKISPYLGNLTNLQNLGLYENALSGTIPPELGKLAHLKTLDLHSNKLTGPIPKEFVNQKSLVYLQLAQNNLIGCVPRNLEKHKQLFVGWNKNLKGKCNH